jgi:signal transduction histidine kinase
MRPLKGRLKFSLRTQFIVPISIMLVLSMLVISGYLIRLQSESYRRELETRGQTITQMLAINAESGVLFESNRELDDMLKVLAQFDDVRYAAVITLNDIILSQVGSRTVRKSHQHTHAMLQPDDSTGNIHKLYIVDTTGSELLIIDVPVVTRKTVYDREHLGITSGLDNTAAVDESTEAIGEIELWLSTAGVSQSIQEAQMAVIFLTVFVLLFAVLVIAVIVSAITNPLTELVTATDQISKGDLDHKVEIDRGDEIGHLALTFNAMVVSLRQSRDDIEQYNRTLEEKIIDRTRQLEDVQNALIQSEKMSAIGQLAAGVAHELNNPLGGILGYAQFTLEKLQKNVPGQTTTREIESYIRYVTDIEVQARRCKQIVQNLLRFSRSSRTMELHPVDLNKVIEETVTFIEHQLHMNQIELNLELDPALPLIQGNAGQLQQVFTNLVINAMHASQPGSAIVIISRYSPAVGEFSGAVELVFVDHGHGIAQENIKKIFEPFFTTKEIGKGTGLGLSVSFGIIKEHGGEITVSSTVGKGTSFIVVLPVQKTVIDTDTSDKKEPNARGTL